MEQYFPSKHKALGSISSTKGEGEEDIFSKIIGLKGFLLQDCPFFKHISVHKKELILYASQEQ
jgi:hypothetical protein